MRDCCPPRTLTALTGYVYAFIMAALCAYVKFATFSIEFRGFRGDRGPVLFFALTATAGCVLVVLIRARQLVGISTPNVGYCRPSGPFVGGGRYLFPASTIEPWIVDNNGIQDLTSNGSSFEFQCPEPEIDSVLRRNPRCFSTQIPIGIISQHLTRQELVGLSRMHGLWVPQRLPVKDVKHMFANHECNECTETILTVFKCIVKEAPSPRLRGNVADSDEEDIFTDVGPSDAMLRKQRREVLDEARRLRLDRKMDLSKIPFPPKRLKFRELHKILTRYCAKVKPSQFVEAGCAVCGYLVPVKYLTPLAKYRGDLSLLHAEGVTRRERFSIKDEICDIDGPVLDLDCSHLCVDCEKDLSRKKIPKLALVQHNWIGKVPPQLQDLTYAEGIMIAKVRHNRCVVRVNSGRVRMSANAVMFSQPYVSVYHKLPPSKEEMNEILAFVFTGSSQPTPEEFERTPMLVRRKKVMEALEWLKLNHQGYVDLEISKENMDTYADRGIPVVVDFRKTDSELDDSVPMTARSVHDANEEEGTEDGPCTFAVHGLTSEEYWAASMNTIKMVALQHIIDQGSVLGIGRSEKPVSMYDAVEAYPGMFPWLFPYGKGGIGHASHKNKLGEALRKKSLLMYHDKRFQLDTYFPMIAFNHEQLKASSNGSRLLTDRVNFNAISRRLRAINPEVAGNIADRMVSGEHVRPATQAESLCFDIIKDLDAVSGHVKGSMTSKKYMRNEIWSTTAFLNAPTWFITLSWSDVSHPIALYYAQSDLVFRPELKSSKIRNQLMSKNPVAAARFFDYMVRTFISEVLGWKKEDRGVFGRPEAYYGTVEQQGRLTLHLHLLLWIHNSLSPQEIRKRLMSEDSTFQRKLVAYLESSHRAEFFTGNEEHVRDVVGLHKDGVEVKNKRPVDPNYKNPTQTLPDSPPRLCHNPRCLGFCPECKRFRTWLGKYQNEVDDLVLRSNIHDHYHSVEDEDAKEKKKDWRKNRRPRAVKQPKTKKERKGCLTKTGVCRARFPRDIVEHTTVGEDGYVTVRHKEPMLNTTNHAVTYLNRCNSDVTSLLSGTAVKAVISYVSDYISKLSLKSYQLFASIHDVFTNKSQFLNGDTKEQLTAVDLMRKMVNSLSSKMEIGSPMASMYVLGNPDHYTSHNYVPFPWRSYVSFIRNFWVEDYEDDSGSEDDVEKLTLSKDVESGKFIATSGVDDYRFRPSAFENVTLLEWIQCGDKKARTKKQKEVFLNELAWFQKLSEGDNFSEQDGEGVLGDSDASDDEDYSGGTPSIDDEDSSSEWETDDDDYTIISKQRKSDRDRRPRRFPFLPGHPRYKTHTATCDFRRLSTIIPNFIGGALPRSDKGDRSYYCMTMLTLFKPWRSPGDLKDGDSTWERAFSNYQFTARQTELMANFNVRYECNDARDDHFAQMRKKLAEVQSGFTSHYGHQFLGDRDRMKDDAMAANHGMEEDEEFESDADDYVGPRSQHFFDEARGIRKILRSSGWLNKECSNLPQVNTDRLLAPYKTRSTWATFVKNERAQLTANKLMNMPPLDELRKCRHHPVDTVEILPHTYFDPRTVGEQNADVETQSKIIVDFKLNTEQIRAFMLLANHASKPQRIPLRMYMGGMGGTGKSRVIKAMIEFFVRRREEYRFCVLGPTGSVAAMLNGSTYHSVFRVPRESKSKNRDDIDGIRNESASLASVYERLQGVDYVLIDEISMVSCNDLQTIATQAAKARNIHDDSFGSLSMITAGDFTQLPPTSGPSLYSGSVGVQLDTATDITSQNAVLGKILWHQFNTVVLLRKNVRQVESGSEEDSLRLALSNMRYGACTEDDVRYLRSKVAGFTEDSPRLDDGKFRNISIITARNIHKDTINAAGAARFARDTGQELVDLCSIDRVSTKAVDKSRWRGCEQSQINHISPRLQKKLWDAPPSTSSDMIPGKLQVCVGMPIMIRSNDATELCITKGQEALVVGWDESIGPLGQRVVDTLFVELVDPPRPVQIPELPVNVVPLVRSVTNTTVLLEDDTLLPVARDQLVALLNFAMTDYASQGKSRLLNLVDLTCCKDHRAFYVALSRGTSAAGTVIVQNFDGKKITSGMSGYLRQELRELEILDEITRLKFEDLLPKTVTGIYRRKLIRSYLLWKGNNADPPHFHPTMRWNKNMGPRIPEDLTYDTWKPCPESNKKRKNPDGSLNETEVARKKKSKATGLSAAAIGIALPMGLIWDAVNYSCGYDTMFTILANIWFEDTDLWRMRLGSSSDMLRKLSSFLAKVRTGEMSFESCRDKMRRKMHDLHPNDFPYGPNGTSMDLVSITLAPNVTYAIRKDVCNRCGFIDPEDHGVLTPHTSIVLSHTLLAARPNGVLISAWLKSFLVKSRRSCPVCGSSGSPAHMRSSSTFIRVPEVLFLSVDSDQIIPDKRLIIDCDGVREVLSLRGIVYAGGAHFVCKLFSKGGKIWYHDGILTGRRCVDDGCLRDVNDLRTLMSTRNRRAVLIIYARR